MQRCNYNEINISVQNIFRGAVNSPCIQPSPIPVHLDIINPQALFQFSMINSLDKTVHLTLPVTHNGSYTQVKTKAKELK